MDGRIGEMFASIWFRDTLEYITPNLQAILLSRFALFYVLKPLRIVIYSVGLIVLNSLMSGYAAGIIYVSCSLALICLIHVERVERFSL